MYVHKPIICIVSIRYVSKFLKKIERKGAELGFRSLHVKNLDEEITVDRLKDKFSEHGNVSSAVIMKDGKGKSRGFGYVNFDSHEGAKKAMDVLNGELIGNILFPHLILKTLIVFLLPYTSISDQS